MDNLNNGIIDLLYKKYKLNNYNEYSINNYRKIEKKELKNHINYDLFILNSVLNEYVMIDNYLCVYDIDILNLIFKSILVNKKLPYYKESEPSNFYLTTLYKMFGYTSTEHDSNINYKKTNDYFSKKAEIINIKVKDYYIKISDIIMKYSR